MQIHPISCGWGIAFLIETTIGLFLIDSGSPDQQDRILNKMKELGRSDLKLIWITHAHYDHYGSASALRKLTGALIGVHEDDAESMTAGLSPLGTTRRYGYIYPPAQKALNFFHPLPAAPPDLVLHDGDTLEWYGLDAQVLHTPGHTPGHTCLKLKEGIVFAGDLLGGFPRPGLQSLLATNWNQLANSLLTLQAARPRKIYLGHSMKPISGDTIC
jgi:glyoxylase-like metal-dependent hydrolase (beta-lactamase superfamily II)